MQDQAPPEIWKAGIPLLVLYVTVGKKSNEIHGVALSI